MRLLIASIVLAGLCRVSAGADFAFESKSDGTILRNGGQIWLETITPRFDKANAEATYKVYTHVYDFVGAAPITKGVGGRYTHHRGMFIGWSKTQTSSGVFNTWGMDNSFQQHLDWVKLEGGKDSATQMEKIRWQGVDGPVLIEEERTITARTSEEGSRLFDFTSLLHSKAGRIELKGDPQHAGMHIRLSNEVDGHPETTQYVLPEGAKETEDNVVSKAWWVCCNADIGGKRYSVLHITHPGHPDGVPDYSTRRYARFGAFSQHVLEEGKPLTFRYRMIISEKPLDGAACARLCAQYK